MLKHPWGWEPPTAPLVEQPVWPLYDGMQPMIVGGKFVDGSMQPMTRFGCLTDLSVNRGKPPVPRRGRG